jgi:FMN-dependent NADH-azoreductase
MSTLLRIDASARTTNSVSRALGNHFEKVWLSHYPRDRVLRRDVSAVPIEHVDDQTITGFHTPADHFTDDLRSATALSDLLINEAYAADVLLLTVPIYNVSVPSALEAWIDQIARIGHTFSFDGLTFTGQLTGRPAYLVCAYGGVGYLGHGHLPGADFVVPNLEFILGFLGVKVVQVFVVEGTVGDEIALAASIERVKRDIEAAVGAASEVAA